jgi:hypothetical protein
MSEIVGGQIVLMSEEKRERRGVHLKVAENQRNKKRRREKQQYFGTVRP